MRGPSPAGGAPRKDNWWNRQSTAAKIVLIVVAVIIVIIVIGGIGVAVGGGKKGSTNKSAATPAAPATTTAETTAAITPAETTTAATTPPQAHGSVAVKDRRGDTLVDEIDILRATLTLREDWFLVRITTLKPIRGYWESASAEVSVVDADGEHWSVYGNWEPETDISNNVIRATTTCEAVKGIDFEHPRRCIARFDKRGVATIRFRASLIRDGGDPNPIEVQFSTSAPHEGDAAPNDEDGESRHVELVVVD